VGYISYNRILNLIKLDMYFKNVVFLSVMLLTLFSCGGSDDGGEEPVVITSCSGEVVDALPTGNNDVLIWAEEFNEDGSPCSKNWTYDLGTGSWGWGNGESQYYTRDNAVVENGVLKIIAKKENYQDSQYTSARIKTQGRFNFTYGRIDVRAKLPASQGTWPAIWMLGSNFTQVGWPHCGEIDIMEQTGNNKNKSLGTVHWWSTDHNASYGLTTAVANASTQFHVYSCEWTDKAVKIYVDDVKYFEMTNSSSLPFYNKDFFIILNVALGGTLGGAIDSNFTEDTMEIDYVRVYQ